MKPKVKVLGVIGMAFDKPKFLDQEDGPIENGDWIVLDGILMKFDTYYATDPTRMRLEDMIKVKKPDWAR